MGLPGFIGILLGALICGPLSDWTIIRLSKANKGIYEPEMRLYLILASIPFLVAGVLTTGIAMDKRLAWEVIAVGAGLLGFGATATVSISYTYLADAYGLVRCHLSYASLVLEENSNTRITRSSRTRSLQSRLSRIFFLQSLCLL